MLVAQRNFGCGRARNGLSKQRVAPESLSELSLKKKKIGLRCMTELFNVAHLSGAIARDRMTVGSIGVNWFSMQAGPSIVIARYPIAGVPLAVTRLTLAFIRDIVTALVFPFSQLIYFMCPSSNT